MHCCLVLVGESAINKLTCKGSFAHWSATQHYQRSFASHSYFSLVLEFLKNSDFEKGIFEN